MMPEHYKSLVLALIIAALAALVCGGYNRTEFIIIPMTHSERGAIGKGKLCPPTTVAVGFRMKIQMPDDIDEL